MLLLGIYTVEAKKIEYPDGRVYEGQVKNKKPNGVGTMRYPDGTIYTGDWVNGMRQGKGEIYLSGSAISSNYWSYSGYWYNDQINGRGTLQKKDHNISIKTFLTFSFDNPFDAEPVISEGLFRDGILIDGSQSVENYKIKIDLYITDGKISSGSFKGHYLKNSNHPLRGWELSCDIKNGDKKITLNSNNSERCIIKCNGDVIEEMSGLLDSWQSGTRQMYYKVHRTEYNKYRCDIIYKETVAASFDTNQLIASFNSQEELLSIPQKIYSCIDDLDGEQLYNFGESLSQVSDLASWGNKCIKTARTKYVPEQKNSDVALRNEQATNLNFSLLGISIGGNVSAFNEKLKKEGCKYIGKDRHCNIHNFKGKVLGKDAYIEVYYDDVSKLVYKVKAKIYELDRSAYKKYVDIANEKYSSAFDKYNSTGIGDYSPVQVYSNGKYSLILDLVHNPNSTCYVNFTYINEDNMLKKNKSDFSIPSLNLTKNGFISTYRNRGRVLTQEGYSDKTFNVDIDGRKADLEIESDGNGRIDAVIITIYYSGDSEGEKLEPKVRKRLDSVFTNARKNSDGNYLLDGMAIIVSNDYSWDNIKIRYVKVKPQRKGGDI